MPISRISNTPACVKEKPSYWLTRYILLRVLGIVYFFAFLSLAFQIIPLIGEQGLTPAANYLEAVGTESDSVITNFFRFPTLFWIHVSDQWMLYLVWLGILLSLLVILGYANSIIMFMLWLLYLSFVHIGQVWYSFGWEIQLLETGLLTIFFVPFWDWRPFPKTAPPKLIIWLYRWLTFRIYLGSGLIKIRGDACWRKLTCLYTHYETQPIPNPLSPWLHFLPKWIHKLGVFWNHVVELIAPFLVFWPRLLRIITGVLFLSFQVFLILSGNLAFLNWITIVPGLALFDDQFLNKVLPKRLVRKAKDAKRNACAPSSKKKMLLGIVFVIVLVLSIPVVQNLASSRQVMNTSFNKWHVVNTYGAFGSIGKERNELVFEGTTDTILNDQTQ